MTSTPDQVRDAAIHALHLLLREHVLGNFIKQPREVVLPVLKRAATDQPGTELALRVDLKADTWTALQAGEPIVAGQLEPAAIAALAPAAMEAITCTLSALPEAEREEIAAALVDAEPIIGLHSTRADDVVTVGLQGRDGRAWAKSARIALPSVADRMAMH